ESQTASVPPLFGIETEYAYVGRLRNGEGNKEKVDDGHVFLRTAMMHLPHLPGPRGDLFLANGSRLYIDCGSHPELATAECTTPWQIVRYVLAGDRIVADVAARMTASGSDPVEGWLSKCNVDYSGSQTTWG